MIVSLESVACRAKVLSAKRAPADELFAVAGG